MSLAQILPGTGITPEEMRLKDVFGDNCGNVTNDNTKKPLLLFEDYFPYKIIFPNNFDHFCN